MISEDPCHTTRHAGPHRAVRDVEVTAILAANAVRDADLHGALDLIEEIRVLCVDS